MAGKTTGSDQGGLLAILGLLGLAYVMENKGKGPEQIEEEPEEYDEEDEESPEDELEEGEEEPEEEIEEEIEPLPQPEGGE